jgi:hypothetical protein
MQLQHATNCPSRASEAPRLIQEQKQKPDRAKAGDPDPDSDLDLDNKIHAVYIIRITTGQHPGPFTVQLSLQFSIHTYAIVQFRDERGARLLRNGGAATTQLGMGFKVRYLMFGV